MDKNEQTDSLYKCIMANTTAVWQHAAHATDQLSSPSCYTTAIPTEKKEKRAHFLTKNTEESSGERNQENGPVGRKKKRRKTERAMRVSRRTGVETVKWNQMTALRFQTGGRHQISPSSLQGIERRRRTRHIIL